MALTAALATAARALEVFTTSVQVSANNIANSNTPGFVREQAKIESAPTFQRGALIIGSGVKSVAIQQVVDQFLEKRLQTASTDAAASNAVESIYAQLELALGELSDSDLSSAFSSLQAAIEEVVNQPELAPLRTNLIDEASGLATDIRNIRDRVDRLRQDQATTIKSLVSEANGLIDQVQDLNHQIAQQEANGINRSEAGNLRTQRYTALRRLAEIIPVEYQERPNGVIDLTSGGDYVLFNGQSQHLQTVSTTDRGVVVLAVEFDKTGTSLPGLGGELQGVIHGRDEVLGGFADQLDELTAGLIFAFNRVHASGEGIDGYASITSHEAVTDSNVSLAQAGLPFAPQHGSFTLKVKNQQTGIVQTHQITIDLDGIGGSDTTLEDLRAAIDSLTNVSSSITTKGQLTLTADRGFELRFSDDSSGVLAALGINTFFTGRDSTSIAVSSEIAANRNLFATGKGGGPADNRNVVALAQVLDQPSVELNGLSIVEYYNSAVSGVAQGSASAEASSRGLAAYRDSLNSQREQFSGVSLDEEAVRLIELQQAYAAAARVIRTVDELYQLLIGL